MINDNRVFFFTSHDQFRRILLDAGDADKPSYIEHLKGVLHTEQASIETILLTHWHHDHIGGVGDVLRAIDGIRGMIFVVRVSTIEFVLHI